MSSFGKSGLYSKNENFGPTAEGLFLEFPKGQQYPSLSVVGSEGSQIQTGFINDLNPDLPAQVSKLDRSLGANYQFRLQLPASVNGVQSTIRFVDLNGVQGWGATNNVNRITICKYSGVGFYRRIGDLGGTVNWANAIANALTFSTSANGINFPAGTFRLATREILLLLLNETASTTGSEIRDPISNQDILTFPNSPEFWTATTQLNASTNAYTKGFNPSTYITSRAKTSLFYPFYWFDARPLISI